MNKYGYLRVAAAAPLVKVADVDYNIDQILAAAQLAYAQGTELLVLPELAITGYTCGDLFGQQTLLSAAWRGLLRLEKELEALNDSGSMAVVVGLPVSFRGALYNCAAIICDGQIQGIVPKTYLPNYNEFYERRWFASGENVPDGSHIGQLEEYGIPFGVDLLFELDGATFGVEICEDMWTPLPPSTLATLSGAQVIVNLSATDELVAKHDYLMSLLRSRSAALQCAYVYASAGAGESSTDLVYSGNAIICENGRVMAESPRFTDKALLEVADVDIESLMHDRRVQTTFADNAKAINLPDYRRVLLTDNMFSEPREPEGLLRSVVADPFVPENPELRRRRCEEVTNIQAEGLVQRLRSTGMKSLTVGISGGLDSTLALLVAVRAFDKLGIPRENIHAVTMPGFGTTDRTYENAVAMIRCVGATFHEIPIKDAVMQHFHDIGHDPAVRDLTYENSQARARTMILMDLSGMYGGFVLGTGDLSELALGWCTYNADQMSMYNVNSSVPKTLVRHLVNYFADEAEPELQTILRDVIDTPVSPELLPADPDGEIAQKTEDLVGPYFLHDFFIFNTLRHGFGPAKIYMLARKAFVDRYDAKTIKHWLKTFYRRFFTQQFKRSCMPDGPKVGSICLSPRGDWRMPSDASFALWMKEAEAL